MEVFFHEFVDFGVGRLGFGHPPGMSIAVYFVQLSTKPSAGVVPVDAWRKGDLGGALSLPHTLICLLPSSLHASYGPLGSCGGRKLGINVGVRDTGALWDLDQGGECQKNERFDLPFAGLNLRRSTAARMAAGIAALT